MVGLTLLLLAFVVPSVVTESSSLCQLSGLAIGMGVTIGGYVIGKISERSLNPEGYLSGGISMGCFKRAGALGIAVPNAHSDFGECPLYTL